MTNLIIKTGYECEPLSVDVQKMPIESSQSYDTHNRESGAEIFRWMYSRVPHEIWDGFFLQGMKTPDVIHKATRKARATIRKESSK